MFYDDYDLEISPYEQQYPLELLSKSIKSQLAKSKDVVGKLYEIITEAAPELVQAYQTTQKKDMQLVVDASKQLLRDIESGKVKLSYSKDGKLFAQLLDDNNRFGSKIPIKKEYNGTSFDPVQIANMMQLQAVQNQLEAMTSQLYEVDRNVKEVLQGQQNDRIGLYYSGLQLFLEAQNTEDSYLKKMLIAQAQRALSDAECQLRMKIDSDITYLKNEEYKKEKRKSCLIINDKMYNIHQSFCFIHQSNMLRAGIYCHENELPAMNTVLKRYSLFIEKTIAKNARMLSECDVNDNGTNEGTWSMRKNMHLTVPTITNYINEKNEFFELEGETNEEE